MRFASLKSSNPAVRARLQAALFTNRKRNKARREAADDTPVSEWGTGTITLGDVDEGSSPGYSFEFGGSMVQPNSEITIEFMCFYEDQTWIDFLGDHVVLFTGSSLRLPDYDSDPHSLVTTPVFDGTRTTVRYDLPAGLNLPEDLGLALDFSFDFAP